MDALEPRVAVLEQIARDTAIALQEIRADIRDIRADLREIRAAQRADFRLLLSIMLAMYASLLGVMAHGFHWI